MRSLGKWLKWAVLGLVALAVVVLAVNNRVPVAVSLFPLPYEMAMPLFFVVLLAFACGALAGWALVSLKTLRLRHEYVKMRTRLQAVQNELAGVKLSREREVAAAAPFSAVKQDPAPLAVYAPSQP